MPLIKMVLKKDIVIPAGTEFSPVPPYSTTEHGEDVYEHTMGVTNDSFGQLYYYMDGEKNEDGLILDKDLSEWFEEVPI